MPSARGPRVQRSHLVRHPTPHHKVLNVEYNAPSILAALIPSSADPWGPLQPALRVPGPAVDEHANRSHRFCPVDKQIPVVPDSRTSRGLDWTDGSEHLLLPGSPAG